jgi:hypothetical protein
MTFRPTIAWARSIQKLGDFAVDVDTKLDLLTRSEQAIARALERTKPPTDRDESAQERAERRLNRAEGSSLLGSNAKTRWMEQWKAAAPDARGASALRSPHLATSIEHYLEGFAEDLDSFYPGINALAMLKIQIELAKQQPAVWAEGFDDDDKATAALKQCEQRAARISPTLHLALGLDDAVARKDEKIDIWKDITCADLSFLTLDRPVQVGRTYAKALANAGPFEVDAARRNVLLFRELGLLPANVEAALKEMQQAAPEKPQPPARVVLFTGHMLDAQNRPADKARFPRTLQAEGTARKMIEAAVQGEKNQGRRRVVRHRGWRLRERHPVSRNLRVAWHPDAALSRLAAGQVPGRVGQPGRAGLGRALPEALPARDAACVGGVQGAATLARRQEGLRYLAAE